MTDTIRMEIELTEAPTNTILLGPMVGNADLDDGRKLEVFGSGKTLRFEIRNKENGKRIRAFDLDLERIAAEVVHR